MKIKSKISLLIIIFMMLEIFTPILSNSKSLAIENEETGGDTELPSHYDLREHIPIKVDEQLGDTCWNYAATKCLETNVAMTTGEYYDFSEMYLEYMDSDKMGGEDRRFDKGGLFLDAMSYYKPYGAALLEDVPNRYYEESEYDTIRNAKRMKEVVESVNFAAGKDWKNFTEEDNIEYRKKVKEHIMKYGGVYAQGNSADAIDETGGMNYETYSYYATYGFTNHAVVVIGWDDNYPKENFYSKCRPKSDGAYIVLNNYGTDWGIDGCYYASYEDLGTLAAMQGIISSRDVDEENVSYHSDYLKNGYRHTILVGELDVDNDCFSYPYYANVFETNGEEYLTKLSFQICNLLDKDEPITYEVYVNPVDGELNSDNLIRVIPEKTVIATETFATEYLENPIKLTGNEYAVVVKCYNNKVYYISEDNTNNYTYTSTNLNSNWSKNDYISRVYNENGAFLTYSVMNIPIMTYTRRGKTIELGNMNKSNYIDYGTETSLSFSATTTEISNGTILGVTIRNSQGDLTNQFTITGGTVNNNQSEITINIPDNTPAGTYIIDVSCDGVTKSKNFTIVEQKKKLVRIEASEPTYDYFRIGDYPTRVYVGVTAYYDDGSSAEVKNFRLAKYEPVKEGQTSVEICYTEDGITKTTEYEITPYIYELSSIEVTTEPNKIKYMEGENFDPAGMEVIKWMYYEDKDRRAEYPGVITDYEIIGGKNLHPGQTKVTIRYTEDGITKETSQEIEVISEKTIRKIVITTPPNKKYYAVGEDFDPAGMVVTAIYDDGSSGIITDYMMTNTKKLKEGQEYAIIFYVVDNKTYTASQQITVRPAIGELLILDSPTKTTYMQGESFDKSGMVTGFIDKDGNTVIIMKKSSILNLGNIFNELTLPGVGKIIYDDIQIIGRDTLRYGQEVVKVSYEYEGVTYIGEVDVSVLNGSEQYAKSLRVVNIKENEQSYRSRPTITPGDLRVIATYDDGSTEEITEYTIVDQYVDENGDRKVTISYQVGDETITETITTGKDTSDDETENESENGTEQEKEIISSDETIAKSVIPKTGVYSISGILVLITAAVALIINKRK